VRECGSVVIADPDDDACAGIAAVLETLGCRPRTVATGSQVLAACASERPSLVVLEVHLPDVSGYEVCRALRERYDDDIAIVFTSADRTESADRVAGLLLGADDYIVKPFAPDEFLARMRRLVAHQGQTPPNGSDLTEREREVLTLLATGLGRREIAARCFITPKTVSKHFEAIFHKLGVHTQAQAVAVALRDGVVDAPTSTSDVSLHAASS
jgi:DNA-binding NarL/FixJ family response regulator